MPDVNVPPGAQISARPSTYREAVNLSITPGSWIVVIRRGADAHIYPANGLVIRVTE